MVNRVGAAAVSIAVALMGAACASGVDRHLPSCPEGAERRPVNPTAWSNGYTPPAPKSPPRPVAVRPAPVAVPVAPKPAVQAIPVAAEPAVQAPSPPVVMAPEQPVPSESVPTVVVPPEPAAAGMPTSPPALEKPTPAGPDKSSLRPTSPGREAACHG
jgi:hypothetical protein